ncbi:hypothetical protein B2D07_08490 [Desulfococcus multivorans]|nr:uncharacterized protein Dmul_17130 [Desulfococcus multivorans]AQV00801.1 hypothetical protein B2D07_08490 [Desulfococcus multivorans]
MLMLRFSTEGFCAFRETVSPFEFGDDERKAVMSENGNVPGKHICVSLRFSKGSAVGTVRASACFQAVRRAFQRFLNEAARGVSRLRTSRLIESHFEFNDIPESRTDQVETAPGQEISLTSVSL